MKRVAILCQNAAFGRSALAALGACWPDGYEPVLVAEGPAHIGQRLAPSYLSLQLKHYFKFTIEHQSRQYPVCWALRFGAQHRRVSEFRGRSAIRLLQRARIDCLICLGFPSLCDDLTLGAVDAALNAHPSLLPRWRGPAPIFWWLRADTKSSGVTVHRMVPAADRGPILKQKILRIGPLTRGEMLAHYFGQQAGVLMSEALEQLARGSHHEREQPDKGCWAPRPRPEDAFVEPRQWTGERLLRFVCGAPYWQTPRIVVGGALFFARMGIEFRPGDRLPGDFVQIGNRLEVESADGVVALEVQGAA